MARSICSVDDCGRVAHGHGFCSTHYMRWRKDGTTGDGPNRRLTEASFWSLVDQSDRDGCWPFTRTKGSVRGYGRISYEGRLWLAHRLAYRFAKGEIPAGYLVRHGCDNPPCCNPAHLSLGKDADNTADRDSRGRTGGAKTRGERHGRAKLTEDGVRRIREMHAEGATYGEIGAAVGATKPMVYSVVKRKSWAWVH